MARNNLPLCLHKYNLQQNPKQNALEFLAFGENFIMDRLTGSKS